MNNFEGDLYQFPEVIVPLSSRACMRATDVRHCCPNEVDATTVTTHISRVYCLELATTTVALRAVLSYARITNNKVYYISWEPYE